MSSRIKGRWFRFRIASDPLTSQGLIAVRVLGIDIAALVSGRLLDWALTVNLQISQLHIAIGGLFITIGRNNDLYD